MEKYKLNSDLIVRENEKTIFSIQQMKIHEFNEDGFNILSVLLNGRWMNINEIIGDIHYKYGINIGQEIKENVYQFIKELEKLKIIDKQEDSVLIKTEKIILREWNLKDAYDLYEYAQDDNVAKNAGWKKHQSIDESKKIIELFGEAGDTYAIELAGTHKVVGSVGLHQITENYSEKMIGIVINPKFQRKGIGSEAIRIILKYAFEQEKLDNIFGNYFTYNKKMIHFSRKQLFDYIGEKDIFLEEYGEMAKEKRYVLSREKYESCK